MKHAIILVALSLAICGNVYGDDFFVNQPLSALQVLQVNPQDGTARITADGTDVANVVRIGDSIAQDSAVITKIRSLYIVVKTEKGTTRLPVIKASIGEGNYIVFQ